MEASDNNHTLDTNKTAPGTNLPDRGMHNTLQTTKYALPNRQTRSVLPPTANNLARTVPYPDP